MNIFKMAALAASLGTGLVAMDHGDAPLAPAEAQQPLLNEASGEILKAWFLAHVANPYPSEAEQLRLAEETQLSVSQVNNWFNNTRARRWTAYLREVQANNQNPNGGGPLELAAAGQPLPMNQAFAILTAWFIANVGDPFPSEATKERLVEETQLSYSQVNSWFINTRARRWTALRAEAQAQGNPQQQNAHMH